MILHNQDNFNFKKDGAQEKNRQHNNYVISFNQSETSRFYKPNKHLFLWRDANTVNSLRQEWRDAAFSVSSLDQLRILK